MGHKRQYLGRYGVSNLSQLPPLPHFLLGEHWNLAYTYLLCRDLHTVIANPNYLPSLSTFCPAIPLTKYFTFPSFDIGKGLSSGRKPWTPLVSISLTPTFMWPIFSCIFTCRHLQLSWLSWTTGVCLFFYFFLCPTFSYGQACDTLVYILFYFFGRMYIYYILLYYGRLT